MKWILAIGLTAMFSICFGCASQNETAAQTRMEKTSQSNKPAATKAKTPVLVELFTSEGCSSCPPADHVLTQLDKEQTSSDAEIITLALHVDYWNYLGWKDEFSSNAFSQRQNGYAERFNIDSIYTPQMVVDGQTQFVGSNLDTAQKAIAEAAKNQKAAIQIIKNGEKLSVKINDLPPHDDSYIWLAIAEDNLKTNVKRGENSGATLTHVSVARSLNLIGNIAAADQTFEIETALQTAPQWKKENLKAIVFVQGKNSKKIFGAEKSVNLN